MLYAYFIKYTHTYKDNFSSEKFIELLSILKSLLMQVPIVRIESDQSSRRHADDADDDDDDALLQTMQVDQADDEDPVINTATIVAEILDVFDSKHLADKIDATLADVMAAGDQATLRDVCLSIAYICDFVLLNSRVKIHRTL